MDQSPFPQFDQWYAQARETEINDSNAVALATADARGRPSAQAEAGQQYKNACQTIATPH